MLTKCINNVKIHQNMILESFFFSLKAALLQDFSHHLEIHKAKILHI